MVSLFQLCYMPEEIRCEVLLKKCEASFDGGCWSRPEQSRIPQQAFCKSKIQKYLIKLYPLYNVHSNMLNLDKHVSILLLDEAHGDLIKQ